MPVPRGQQIKREKVLTDLAEIQEITNLCESRKTYDTQTELFVDIAAEYNRRHPELEGKVTYTVIRLRFDKGRTPGTTLTCQTSKARGRKKTA